MDTGPFGHALRGLFEVRCPLREVLHFNQQKAEGVRRII